MKTHLKRSMVLFCILALFVSSCKKSTTNDENVVSTKPDEAISSSDSGDFELADDRGVSVIGKDIPFGDVQPDMDRYFDPDYQNNTNVTDTGTDPMGIAEADNGMNQSDGRLTPDLSSIFRTIYFDYDKHNIKRENIEVLGNIADFLSNNTYSVLVEGHCDARGSNAYNLALGEKRALAVREYLVSLGISPSRVNTVSFGEEKPVEPGNTKYAWSMNRRVEFKVKINQ